MIGAVSTTREGAVPASGRRAALAFAVSFALLLSDYM